MKPDPEPLYRTGFCQGCKRWIRRGCEDQQASERAGGDDLRGAVVLRRGGARSGLDMRERVDRICKRRPALATLATAATTGGEKCRHETIVRVIGDPKSPTAHVCKCGETIRLGPRREGE